MTTISLLAFFGLAALDWYAVAQADRRLEYIAKPAALAALIVFASTGPSASPWLIAALCLGLLGDVYLMLPVDLFVAGLAAFLLGHFAYIVELDAPALWRVLWFVVIVGATYPLSRRIMGSVQDAAMRPAVIVYLAVISFMAASAFASGLWSAAIGASLFVASDTILAWDRFVRPLPSGRIAVIVTYHLGQLGLAYALR